MKLYLLRHGETDWNLAWKLQGRTDIPLNEKGLSQAREAAMRLQETDFDAVFSSPLQRAQVTAEIIAAPHRLSVQTDERLSEMGFGIYEGTAPQDMISDKNRKLLFDAPQDYVAPEGGENFSEVSARCQSFLDYLLASGYNSVLIVSHGALIHTLLQIINKTDLKDFWGSGVLKNCEALEINLPTDFSL